MKNLIVRSLAVLRALCVLCGDFCFGLAAAKHAVEHAAPRHRTLMARGDHRADDKFLKMSPSPTD